MKIGIVIIGRNEGERLRQCFYSVLRQTPRIVYVDSGSTDGSVELARSLSVEVVELDLSFPFTAARARNAGLDQLIKVYPELEFVQFVDGDCEVVSGWLETAYQTLINHPEIAVVCGRLRERFPNASIYNRLCDLEWHTPVGEAKACGGNAMMRVVALRQVEGFNTTLIAGEEPELCYRLRQQGWKIWRLDAEMALHDAAMTTFGQWWKRSIRGGWAIAEGKAMYANSAEAYKAKENFSGWLWGFMIPFLSLSLIFPTRGFSLVLWLAYPYLLLRIYQYRKNQFGNDAETALLYASLITLSKFPQFIGQAKYYLSRWSKQPATLIEYKAQPRQQEQTSRKT